MNDLFWKMNTRLKTAWPNISAIDWSRYGNEITGYDPNTGLPKYTGVITHFKGGETALGAYTQTYGFLPDPGKSVRMVMNKVTALSKDSSSQTSLGIRNPNKNIYGGGIRLPDQPYTICALSGLPEIADHVILATLMYKCDAIPRSQLDDILLLRTSSPATEAMASIGMTKKQYDTFVKTVCNIIFR